MTVEVMRIQNPQALTLPTIERLLRRALETHSFVEDVDEALLELEYWVQRPHAGIFVVRENGTWVGFGFAQWGESAFSPFTTVVHVYNEGSREVLKKLQRAMVAFARLGGYSKGMTVDINDKPKGFRVLFSEGGTPEPVGTLYVFDLDGGAADGRQHSDEQTAGSDAA